MKLIIRIFLVSYLIVACSASVFGVEHVIKIPLVARDATESIAHALAEAATNNGEKTVIEFEKGDYNISREHAVKRVYRMSNTASERENSDPTKHIGIFLQKLDNVTLKGNGARIVTHGEMTQLVIDSCSNIEISGLTFTAADPSVTEILIKSKDDTSVTFEVLPMSEFSINEGVFSFVGEEWSFGDPKTGLYAYAQVYHPESNITRRCRISPVENYKSVKQVGHNLVRMEYDNVPDVEIGDIYQLRHWIRNEVGGFINLSKDIIFRDVTFNFLGNFALLSQYSENLTMENVACVPDEENGRTNAGFADFFHFSGCKGHIKVKDCTFIGAQDDGINIHGTHLKIVEQVAPDRLKVRFMHPQTFGFQPFFIGDEIEIVSAKTLNALMPSKIKSVEAVNEYDYIIALETPLPETLDLGADLVVENVTWTPEVEITGNYFARIPTRGILLTTRRRSVIENNTFFRLPMAAILVADDASSWYESGPVRDLTIKGNDFIDCSIPNIRIEPEIKIFDKPVHSNILIEGNRFFTNDKDVIQFSGAENVVVKDNRIEPLGAGALLLGSPAIE